MTPLNILVGCEYTATVRDRFRAVGHNAWSCDLLPTEGDPRYHIQRDLREVLHGHAGIRWDMLIFFPDCTYLTNSAAWAYGDGPYHQKVKPGTLVGASRRAARAEAVAFFKQCWSAPIHYKAAENPVGHLSAAFRKPDQIVQPYYFGADASKATCLWLENLPQLKNGQYVNPRMVCYNTVRGIHCGAINGYEQAFGRGCHRCGGEPGLFKPRWSNQTDTGQNRLSPSDTRGLDRARTYPGIADAMLLAWYQMPKPERT